MGLSDFRGLQILDPDPTGAGGLAINDDLKELARRIGPHHEAAEDPDGDDDGEGTGGHGKFYLYSHWLNTSSNVLWVCLDNATGAAVWMRSANFKLVDDTAPQLGGNLDLNGYEITGNDITIGNGYITGNNLDIGNNLSVSGGGITISGSDLVIDSGYGITLTGDINSAGTINTSGTLTTSGTLSACNNLTVTGGEVTISGSDLVIEIGYGLTLVSGTLSVSDNLTVTGGGLTVANSDITIQDGHGLNTTGTITGGHFIISGGSFSAAGASPLVVMMVALPTSDPHVTGQLYVDTVASVPRVVRVSNG